MTFADHIMRLLRNLQIDQPLPAGVKVLNPYLNETVLELCETFYRRFFDDDQQRRLILGINPGRFGGGVTGIPFTDPVKLAAQCGIPNTLGRRTELSADFIYRVVESYGGPARFYGDLYISAVSPLGFTRGEKNLNYYDIPALQEALKPFVVTSITETLRANIDRSKCYCIGEGQNFRFLSRLNAEHQWFKEIIPLTHPRFVMQYRRKHLREYVAEYCGILGS